MKLFAPGSFQSRRLASPASMGVHSPRATRASNAAGACGLSEAWNLQAAFEREALLSPNPVLKSLLPVLRTSRLVSTHPEKILALAKSIKDQNMTPSDWKYPAFIAEDSQKTVQFFMIGNAINFKFWGKNAADRFATEYRGTKWDGANAMWACLKRACEEGIPVLSANYLAALTPDQAGHIFRGNMEIPMLKERVAILNEVGKVLKEKYDGEFYNLYKASGGYAFHRGSGMVERLVRDFPSFRDEATDPLTHKKILFEKRAQLAVAMLAGRLKGTGLFDVRDLNRLTVFADYELPKSLNQMGLIEYRPSLAAKIRNGALIPKGSREEIEIRAHTLYAAKLLELALHGEGRDVNALNVDFLLWSEGRGLKSTPHHLTETTAY